MFKIFPRSIETLRIAEDLSLKHFMTINNIIEENIDDKLFVVSKQIYADSCLVFEDNKLIDGFIILHGAYYKGKSFEELLNEII